jgi:hypothetical protein
MTEPPIRLGRPGLTSGGGGQRVSAAAHVSVRRRPVAFVFASCGCPGGRLGEADDVLRVEIPVTRGTHMETLALYFPVVGPYETMLHVHWGQTVLPIRVEVPR